MIATCPSVEELRALSFGRLSEEESGHLLQHIGGCDACRHRLTDIDSNTDDSLIGQLRENRDGEAFLRERGCQTATAKAMTSSLAQTEEHDPFVDVLPNVIAEYEIIRPAGRGGMGCVYLARHTKLDREVAVKVLSSHRLAEPRVRERFAAEMRTIGNLSHPNIVSAYDAREVDGLAVLVTEFIHGLDVGEIVKRLGPLAVEDACAIGAKIACALRYVHEQNLVHRDVKPSNLMINTGGDVKLLDLGLARLQEPNEQAEENTSTGEAMGTADYIAPEQIRNSRAVDFRADVYSLGCTLFKMLSGRAPFDEISVFAKLNAHVTTSPPSLKEAAPNVPAAIAELVDSMLEKDPERRPACMEDIANLLGQYVTESHLKQLVTTAREASRRDLPPRRASLPTRVASKRFLGGRKVGAAIVGCLVAGTLFGYLAGVVITIRRPDGTETVVESPDKSRVAIDEEGNAHVTLSESSRKSSTRESTGTGTMISPRGDTARELAKLRYQKSSWLLYVAQMDLMNQAWQAGNFVRLRRLLQESVPGEGEHDFRGWEWFMLHEQAQQSMTQLKGVEEYSGVAAYSPASYRFAAATLRDNVDILDREGKKVLRSLDPNSGEIRNLVWSPSGELIACGAIGGLSIWDAASGQLLQRLRDNPDMRAAMAWSPDGKLLASAGADGRVRIWNITDGTEIRAFGRDVDGDYVTALDWHLDGNRLASAHRWGAICIWDASDGAQLSVFRKGTSPIYAVAWSPDGTILASGRRPDVDLWSAEGVELQTLSGHNATVKALSWDPNGMHLLSGSDDRTARIWDVEQAKTLRILPFEERVRSVAWMQDAEQVMLGTAAFPGPQIPGARPLSTGGVFLVKSLPKANTADITVKMQARDIAWSPRGKQIAAIIGESSVELRGASDREQILELEAPECTGLWDVAWSPDGARVAAVDWRNGTYIWDAADGKRLARLVPEVAMRNERIAWSPNGNLIAVSNGFGNVEVWDAQTWDRVTTLSATNGMRPVTWSPDSRLLAAGSFSADPLIHVWNAEDWREVFRSRAPNAVAALTFSPDGRWLAAGSNVDLVFYRTSDGTPAYMSPGEHGLIVDLKWSADTRRIAAACEDGAVRIWDAATATQLLVLQCSTARIHSIDWSPNGLGLACCDAEGTLRIWTVPATDSSTTAQQILETGVLMQ